MVVRVNKCRPLGTRLVALQEAIITPIRIINDIFANGFFKWSEFSPKINYFMLSKTQIKFITGLRHKKFREASGLFFAEGPKVVSELATGGFQVEQVFTVEDIPQGIAQSDVSVVSADELAKISVLSTPNQCLALFRMPEISAPGQDGLLVGLDDVRDPGNLGTIIRLCDWFGVTDLICSNTSADVFNPKVVQATMGSLARVRIHYLDLAFFLQESKLPVFGAFMDGENIYKTRLPNRGIIILGNEANGISAPVGKRVSQRLAIPRFGDLQRTESLNVATAAAIVLSEFRRNL
jgi:RNA methyltransferase, TrmH family